MSRPHPRLTAHPLPPVAPPPGVRPARHERLVDLAAALLASAGASHAGALAGCHLAVLCQGDHRDVLRFQHAAFLLGARVTRLTPFPALGQRPDDPVRMGVALGRLYDAIECVDQPKAVVAALADAAGVPVFDGLGSDRHETAPLAALLDPEEPEERRREAVLQAALLSALSSGLP